MMFIIFCCADPCRLAASCAALQHGDDNRNWQNVQGSGATGRESRARARDEIHGYVEHAVIGKQKRHLDEERETSPGGIHAFLFVEAEISWFISALRGSRRLYFLYFSWMDLICGATRCILSMDFICVRRSGSRAR